MYIDESDFDFSDSKITESSECPTYDCDHCGEENQLLIDVSEGTRQTFVQDCPVC